MTKSALVIAAHPDDEVLGCGGTIASFADNGWAVHVAIMAEGLTSRDATRNRDAKSDELSALAQSAHMANKELGAASLVLMEFPDNRMDSVDLLDVVKPIEALIAKHAPSIVFTHNANDINIDHQIVHDAVVTACRPASGSCVRELLFFEIPSSTEWRPATSRHPFTPSVYYDISGQLGKKKRALEVYASEMRDFPHPRSPKAIEALAIWRGASCGYHAAEAFSTGYILRSLNDKT